MPPCDIYARVFENAQTGLLLLERDTGRILEVNAAFLRMAGRGCTEVVGRSFWAPPLVADVDAGAEIHGHLLAGGPQRSRGKHVAQVAAAIRAGYRNRPGSEPGYGARDGRPRPGAADHLEPGRQFAGGDGARGHLLPADRQLANRGAGVREW